MLQNACCSEFLAQARRERNWNPYSTRNSHLRQGARSGHYPAKLTQTSMLPRRELTGSELIGPEFSLHSFYKRVETTEPHFQ